MLTTEMPEEARILARTICKYVLRPKLPRKIAHCLRFRRNGVHFCPMGLLPGAKQPDPSYSGDFAFPPGRDFEIEAFAHWWDDQRNAQAAMDAVWPKKKSKAAKKK